MSATQLKSSVEPPRRGGHFRLMPMRWEEVQALRRSRGLEKEGEFAPGIPSRAIRSLPTAKTPRTWEMGLHRHLAERAGEHYDLRLGDPRTGRAHSWAMREGLPGPGEKRLAVQQPTHTIGYMDFSGPIKCLPSGVPVSTSRGQVPIEELEPSRDEVLGVGAGGIGFFTLERVYYGGVRSIWIRLDIQESKNERRSLTCGVEHLVYAIGKGFVRAEHLSVGDAVLLEDSSNAHLHLRVAGGTQKDQVSRVMSSAERERHEVVCREPALFPTAAPTGDVAVFRDCPSLFPPHASDGPAAAECTPAYCPRASVRSYSKAPEGVGYRLPVHAKPLSDFVKGEAGIVVEADEKLSVIELGDGSDLPLHSLPSSRCSQVLPDLLAQLCVVRHASDSLGDRGASEAVERPYLSKSQPSVDVVDDFPVTDSTGPAFSGTELAHRLPEVRYGIVQKVSRESRPAGVYDLLVEGAHNYFAGGVLVHNSGYGKGDVQLAQRDKAEVLHSSNKDVRFNVYKGKENQEFALRKTKAGDWMVQNVTPSRKAGPSQALPSSKPKYKERRVDQLNPDDPNTELQAKIDGAHVLYQFKSPGTTPRVFSYRPTERATGVIDHTQKLPGFHKRKTPSRLKDTILRGELYAVDSGGKALPAARVGGILNAGVWKSREKQKQEGRLVPVAFDVVRFKGKDVENAPYAEKRELLSQAMGAAPWLQRPRTASTPAAKRKLIADIEAGREPSTEEGVVEWHKDKPTPVKAKFKAEKDVFVRSVFPERGTKRQGTMAGGFEFSYTKNGPVVGRVGTGMSHSMKKDMVQNPSKYEGLQARVTMQRAPMHYAPRAPAFKSFHLDQDIPEDVKTAAAPVGLYKGKPAKTDTTKFKLDFQGIPIYVDRPRGFVMMGRDEKGKPWSRRYRYDYGHIPRTLGGDHDGLDVFIGPKKKAEHAYWAIQKKPDGTFDEYKVFLGFDNRDEAIAAYRAHIPKRLFSGLMTMKVEMMKAMLGKNPEEHMKVAMLLELTEILEARK